MDNILLIDDELDVLEGQKKLLRFNGFHDVLTAGSGGQARGILEGTEVSLVLLDLTLKDESGITLLAWLHQHFPDTAVIVVTGASEVAVAVRCMQAGAHDFLVKGTDTDRLVTAIRNALAHQNAVRERERLRQTLIGPQPTSDGAFDRFITRSERMHRIFIYLEAVASLPDPLLITGETGVGKEVIARAVHDASGFEGDFVPVNLGGLDDHVVSDTLFGHERGAFTGADRARKGLVRTAAGGTLFLDEFAELHPDSQTKLLRLLDSGEFMPMGSDRSERSKTRIILATNRDLESDIGTGRFRKDLYFRIAAHRVHVPPLRERSEDVAPILAHLMRVHSRRLGREPLEPSESFLNALGEAPLDGNVRELEQIVLSTLVDGRWPELTVPESRSTAVTRGTPRAAPPGDSGDLDRTVVFGRTLPTPAEAVEELLAEADRRYPNNRSAAAAAIGLSAQAFANRWRRMTGGRSDED